MMQAISHTTPKVDNSFADYPIRVSGDTIRLKGSSCPSDITELRRKLTNHESHDNNAFIISNHIEFHNFTELYRLNSYTHIEFDKIKRLYTLINEDELRQYLEINQSLYSIFIKGIDFIKKIVGNDASASLELYTFIEGGNKAIFINIFANNEISAQDDIEDIIVNELISYSSRPLNGKIVVSLY
jgi:hypothetical protein